MTHHRRRRRGFLTIEAMLVTAVATMAVMEVGPFAPPVTEAERMSAAEHDAFRLRYAAQVQREDTGRCPTTASLLAAGEVRAEADPWKKPYWVYCLDGEVTVVSDGPDGAPFTADDLGAREIPWAVRADARPPRGHHRRMR